MVQGPWGTRFVGSHIVINEPGMEGGSWDNIPSSWFNIRFDAVDVLFISPFYINPNNYSFELGTVDNGSLLQRLHWVIRAARSKNANIKIIVEQFYTRNSMNYKLIENDENKIKQYADSVAHFIEGYANLKLPALEKSEQVAAHVDGFDVDVKSDTSVEVLPKILEDVRASLKGLSDKLHGTKFSVSITPAFGDRLDASMAHSCDYINMKNYSDGKGTPPQLFQRFVPDLEKEQKKLVWGFSSEMPWDANHQYWANTTEHFPDVKYKAEEVAANKWVGTYTWRLNSDNSAYANMFQVWLYNLVHGIKSPDDAKHEELVHKYWEQFGGRTGFAKGARSLSAQELI